MKSDAFNLRHLRAFCAVAACGSVSGASTRVFLSQPAITQAIAKLERTLGVALFTRQGNGIFPTATGAMFSVRAERALALLRAGASGAAKAGRRGRRSGFQEFDRLVTGAQLRTLLAMSDTGNFSWAARRIGVSQPSVHRAARNLERLSGMPLFSKTASGIELSRAAEILERHTRLAFAELAQGVAEIVASRGEDTTHIAIGSLPLARTYVLPTAINELVRVRPYVRVSVVDGPYPDLVHGLRHGRIDLVIGALRHPPPVADVAQEHLFDDELAIVARAGHPLAGRPAIAAAELAGYPWVTPGPDIPTRSHFDKLFAEAGVAPPARLVESSSLILVRGLLLGSDRLTIISAHQVRHEIGPGLLVRLNVDLPRATRPIGIATRRDWRPTATQTLLLDLLRRVAARRHAEARPPYSETE